LDLLGPRREDVDDVEVAELVGDGCDFTEGENLARSECVGNHRIATIKQTLPYLARQLSVFAHRQSVRGLLTGRFAGRVVC